MVRYLNYYIVLLAVAVLVIVAVLVFKKEPIEYLNEHHVRYSFVIENPTEKVQKNVSFWSYAPFPQSSTQKRIDINASHSFDIQKDKYGNERMYFKLGDIAPRGHKIVKVDAVIATTNEATGYHEPVLSSFLQPQRYIESNTKNINELSNALVVSGDEGTSKNIYNWVSGNLSYSGYVEKDRGALFALEQKEGDCSEYSYLVTALSRSAGISSKVIAGFLINKNSVLKPADYHNWSKVYYDGSWHIVDALNGNYNRGEGYIAFRIVGDELINSQKLYGTDSNIKVHMGG